MEICGKKQIDIREDNKSAVIDVLLRREATTSQLTERLKLSHTALAKVLKELMQKNVVFYTEGKAVTSGRPPKIYQINGECAISCAVIVSAREVCVYYIDMRGFQVNKRVFDNDFSSFDLLLRYVKQQILDLKDHPRLREKILKYIYIGLPTADFYGMTYAESSLAASRFFSEQFSDVSNIVYRNIDYEMIAEMKYGVLKNGVSNAVLINLDCYVDVSFLMDGKFFRGDDGMQGYSDKFPRFTSGLETGAERIAEAYCRGEQGAVEQVESSMRDTVAWLRNVIEFLNIRNIVLTGNLCKFGKRFFSFLQGYFGEDYKLYYSSMGKDVPASLSGAVWLATYSTLQDIILR